MAQRIFVKVLGFTDEERHALNTLFRLSEQCLTMYQLWSPAAPGPAGLALLDGQSYEARLEAESPMNAEVKLLWIGDDPPAQVWRAFPRPVQWLEILEAIDALFQTAELDFDLDLSAVTAGAVPSSRKQALLVSPSLDSRLYLRARLALAGLTQADEADSGSQALELAGAKQYDFAVVDFALPDTDAWALVRQLREGKKPIAHVAITKAQRSVPERVRAWMGGAEALLDSPPHPQRLNEWLKRI